MISLSLHLPFPSPLLLSPPRPSFPNLSPLSLSLSPPTPLSLRTTTTSTTSRPIRFICRADLSLDAPFAIAIGACMLNSLVFSDAPEEEEEEEEEGGDLVGPTDAKFTVMSVISFIPYFNWLSWVFAWMDTSKRRYAVYALVYLAPYFRSNLSLSPDDSWLPIASIVLCIIHIHIEASIQSGDLDSLLFFSEAVRRFSPAAREKDRHHERREEDPIHLPSAQERLRDEIRKFGMPQKPFRDHPESETTDEEKEH